MDDVTPMPLPSLPRLANGCQWARYSGCATAGVQAPGRRRKSGAMRWGDASENARNSNVCCRRQLFVEFLRMSPFPDDGIGNGKQGGAEEQADKAEGDDAADDTEVNQQQR